LAPFLGARDTATIHPLFLGLKLFYGFFKPLRPLAIL
jgi:hypothetical protein